MKIVVHKSSVKNNESLVITGSKSESNRLLVLQALLGDISIDNISNSDDSQLMQNALASKSNIIDIHHAGTAMRFLTAYFAIKEHSEVLLTGSTRMKQRPIAILVNALKTLGADIKYVEKEGFPPLKINGKLLNKNKVSLNANVSSQYISALLLIAPKLKNGLKLTLIGEITSKSYINMTLSLLNQIGVKTQFKDNIIAVKPKTQNSTPNTYRVESDWSSASYYYSIIALSDIGTKITLSWYKENSIQGDSALVEIYKQFGVSTKFAKNSITLLKEKKCKLSTVNCQLNTCPDIAQTIAVTCFGLSIGCYLTGLHTLKIKETDRLQALKIELEKLDATVNITKDSLTLNKAKTINSNVEINTYNDHRMAMAFAPLAVKTNIIIKEAMVVSKSYPTFWNHLEKIGFKISEIK